MLSCRNLKCLWKARHKRPEPKDKIDSSVINLWTAKMGVEITTIPYWYVLHWHRLWSHWWAGPGTESWLRRDNHIYHFSTMYKNCVPSKFQGRKTITPKNEAISTKDDDPNDLIWSFSGAIAISCTIFDALDSVEVDACDQPSKGTLSFQMKTVTIMHLFNKQRRKFVILPSATARLHWNHKGFQPELIVLSLFFA